MDYPFIDFWHLYAPDKQFFNRYRACERLWTAKSERDRAAILRLQPSLNLLKAKTDRPTMSDIEACLILLYQIMLLRLQKKEITPETASVQQQATQVLQFLSRCYLNGSMEK